MGGGTRVGITNPHPQVEQHACILYTVVGGGTRVGSWARLEGTPTAVNPNKPLAHITNPPLVLYLSNKPLAHITNTPLVQSLSNKPLAHITNPPLVLYLSNKPLAHITNPPLVLYLSNKPLAHITNPPLVQSLSNKPLAHITNPPLVQPLSGNLEFLLSSVSYFILFLNFLNSVHLTAELSVLSSVCLFYF